MDFNLLIAVLITATIAIAIVALSMVFSHNKTIKGITDIFTGLAPNVFSAALEAIELVQPDLASKLGEIREIAITAVTAVEQISTKRKMTSAEKKELAIEYYEILADELGFPELVDIQKKTLDIIIENAVLEMERILFRD